MKRAALLLAVLLAPALASATVRDYQVDNPEWNGLSDLAALAESRGAIVLATDHVDWGDLDPEKDVVLVLYPQDPLDALQVATWVRAGGSILLADDFGQCDDAFAEFGLRRGKAAGVHAQRWHEDNPALPVATAWADDHPLARDADEIITNHPAVLTVTRGNPDVVFGFGRGEALVVAGKLGDGRFVALADPSVLINGMLQFDGNAGFASDLLAFLAPPRAGEGGRVVVLTHRFLLTGQPPERLGGELGLPGVAGALRGLDRWMKQLSEWLPDDQALRAIAVLGAFALLLAGMAVLPLQRRERLDGAWTRAHGGHQRVDVEQLMEHYDNPRWDGSYAYPAALLREGVEARIAELIGAPEPFKLPPADLIARVSRAAGQQAASAVDEALDRLRSLPNREQAAALFHARVVSRREFERVYHATRALERALPES